MTHNGVAVCWLTSGVTLGKYVQRCELHCTHVRRRSMPCFHVMFVDRSLTSSLSESIVEMEVGVLYMRMSR